MIVITELERDQLVDHILKSDDIWSAASGLYLRSTDDGSAFGLQLQKHEIEGRTVFVTTLHPQDWSEHDAKEFVERLVHHWTSYLQRTRLQEVLEVECSVDSGKAELIAMKLQELAHAPVDAPGLTPDLPETEVPVEPKKQAFMIRGGGYVRITPVGKNLHAELSLPSGSKHLGFSPPLEGFLSGPVKCHTAR
jgi:hypothetical protein